MDALLLQKILYLTGVDNKRNVEVEDEYNYESKEYDEQHIY